MDTVCEKEQHRDSARNLDSTCCPAWHSRWKLQYDNVRVFECESEESTEDSKKLDGSNHDYEGKVARKKVLFVLIRTEFLNLLVIL